MPLSVKIPLPLPCKDIPSLILSVLCTMIFVGGMVDPKIYYNTPIWNCGLILKKVFADKITQNISR